MKQQLVPSFGRRTYWLSLLCLAILAAVMTACGGSSSASTTTSSSTQSNSSSSQSSGATITITEKTGGHDIYSFDPQTVTIKAGGSVTWMNKSDENHLLASSPDGVFTSSSIVPRSGSDTDTYQVTFPKAGTYTITSTLVKRENNQTEGASSSATATITVQ